MRMSMKKKYQVFISSTYEDLVEERKEVVQAVLACNCIPAGMELFPASNRDQWDVIKGVIDDCDYYLVIVAGKYGSQGIDESGKLVSYTEMEFDYALKTDKPIIALVHRHPEIIPAYFTEKNEEAIRKLDSFRNKIMNGRVVAFWDNKDNLNTEVIKSLTNICINSPGIGWIKGDEIGCRVKDSDNLETVVIKVKSAEDAREIAEHLTNNKVVVFNCNGIDMEVAQRVIDFVSGVLFGLNGTTLQKISSYIYIATPDEKYVSNPEYDELMNLLYT